jgi:uncharacterized protein
MSLEYKTLTFKAKSDGGLGDREFDGYASTFLGPVDSYGDIIQKGAFANRLEWFMENGILLREHNIRCAIGKPLEAYEDEHGLYLKGYISKTSEGNDALILLQDRVIKRMSIGFRIEGYEMLSEARAIEVLGSKDAYDAALKALPWWVDGLRLLTDIWLYETSLVAFPANEDAIVSGVKTALQGAAAKMDTERKFERFLRDAGFSVTEAKTIVSLGYKALQRDAEAGSDATERELAESIKAMTAAIRG